MSTPQRRRVTQAKVKLKSHTAFRMNILFFSIFLLFSLLIFRLGYLQIVKGEDFVRALARTTEVSVNTNVPRGRIFDNEGRVLVDNEPVNAITYTSTQTTKRTEMLEVAEKLAGLIEQPTTKVTRRDKQDFYIFLYPDKAAELVTEEERSAILNSEDTEKEKQSALDALTREKITDDVLKELTKDQLEVLAIYREMTSGYALTPQVIKSDGLTDAEFARVSERLGELPGINTMTDWKRLKTSDLTILGSTTTPEQGIPANRLDYFLARDYSRNDRVGVSFLEEQYESVLQGQKTVVKNVTDNRGQVVDTIPVEQGKPGRDLVLTIDSELQSELEKLVEDKLLELKAGPNSELVQDAYLIMMEPKTGEVVSLVGKRAGKDADGKTVINDYSFGAFNASYEMGSTVKGATLLTGYSKGAVEINETLIDEPIKIAQTPWMRSVFNREPFNQIPMNDLQAIARSSNAYMIKIALALSGNTYQYNGKISVSDEDFSMVRNSFAQFGLGVKTGIDLPGEGDGLKGVISNGGQLLYQSIGQFDTYTPLQLAQYISTIANDGYRMEPHLVKEIREPSQDGKTLGPIETAIEPKVLNRIDNTQEEIDRVKQGMRLVYTDSQGTAASYFRDAPYTAAGKTGTAQVTFYTSKNDPLYHLNGTESVTLTHVGFAPYENPEIAYAVVVPYITTDLEYIPRANNQLAKAAVDKYFELKEKAEENNDLTIKPPYTGSVPEPEEEPEE